MNLFENLDAWTFETVVEIVRSNEFEPSQFDYKEVLHATQKNERDKVNLSILRTACSMSNSGGGVIIFGVRDRRHPVARDEERIVGIPLGEDLRKQFGDKLQDLQPEVHFETVPNPIVLPNDSTRGIFVVRIPASPLRPHMIRSQGVFFRRGEGGAAIAMDFYEVREQIFFNEERLRRTAVLRLEIAEYRQLVSTFRALQNEVSNILLRFDTGAFKIFLAETLGLLAKENSLVAQLRELPSMANIANRLLDEASSPILKAIGEADLDPSSPIKRRQIIFQTLKALDEQCARCESRLQEIFGPLVGFEEKQTR